MTEIVCRECGSLNYTEEPHEMHGAKISCADCGTFIKWKGKGNRKNRRNKNPDHMNRWRKKGPLVCHWCGITEGETAAHFELDHIMPLENGGQDVFENTRPLCSACHWSRNAELHRMRLLRRINERTEMYKDYLHELEESRQAENAPF